MASPVGDSVTVAAGNVVFAGKSGTVAATANPTINDYFNQRVFQRVGTSKLVQVSGTCTGNPSLLQWRVIDHTSSAGVTAWATLIANPPANFSTYVSIPQGGWYKVQVRCANDNSKIATTSNKMGVGVVIGMFGQSNMVNRQNTSGSNGLRPLGDKRAVWYNTTYDRVGNLNDNAPANTESTNSAVYNTSPGVTIQSSVNGDGFVYTANLISQALNVPVCQVFYASGGTNISQWLPGQTLWNTFASKVTAVGDMEVAIWHQGESDANLMSTATMKTNLGTLHNGLKALTGRNDSNFKFAIIAVGTGPFGGSSQGEFGNIRAAHVQYATGTAGAYLSTCAHDTATGSDTVHIGNDFNKISRRDAKSFLFAVEGIGTSGAGPYITGASRSDTTVTVAVSHSGGTSLTDGAGGSGTALTGFQFFDAGAGGAEIAVTATSISGNTMVLTIANTPVGALTFSYAMANVPHGVATSANSFVPASCVYDNTTYHNSTVGCPLQPLAAISVT